MKAGFLTIVYLFVFIHLSYSQKTTFLKNCIYIVIVVPNFIIQGGSSDGMNIAKRRKKIGRYLLPPDTKRGYTHKRGAVSMPSSEIENPYKLASPYQFFIVNRTQ